METETPSLTYSFVIGDINLIQATLSRTGKQTSGNQMSFQFGAPFHKTISDFAILGMMNR